MSTAGLLSVILGIDTTQFSTGLKTAEGSLAGFASKFGGLAAGGAMSVATAGITAAGAALAGLGSIAAESLWAWDEQEKANNKLEAVLASTGNAAGMTAGEIEDLASELQKTTRFADETTVAAAAVLATFTKIRGDVFKDALISAQDLSAVMQQDLQSSIVQIGKALNDPLKGMTALRRVGVSFSMDQIDAVEKLVEAGKLYEAQQIILTELNTEFGGSAVAAAKDLGGQLEILHHQIDELSETFGQSLTPAVKLPLNLLITGIPVVNDALHKMLTDFANVDPTGYLKFAAAADAILKTSNDTAIAAREFARAQHEAFEEADKAVQSQVDAEMKLEKPMHDLLFDMQQQIDTWGMSARAVAIYKAEVEGVPPALTEATRAAAAQLDMLEKQKKAAQDAADAQKKAAGEAKKVYDETRTPLEKYQAELEKIQGMALNHKIDIDTFKRKRDQLQQELAEATGKHGTEDRESPAAVAIDTQEAYSAIAKASGANSGKTPLEGLKKNSDNQVQLATLGNVYLRQLATSSTPIVIGALG